MNKTTVIRRIIGIIALVCWAVAFVPWIVLPDGDRLAWQLQNWAMASSSILTIVYIIVLTVQYNSVRHLVSFYRLSDLSYCYDQSQNDSHIELTSQ